MDARPSVSVVAMPKSAARRRQDTEFLPAALEIIETPPSPAGRAVSYSIILFTIAAFAWSMLGRVDIVATASGRVIPTGKSKIIQPYDTGVVRAIKVVDGQAVKKGDVLLEIDPTSDLSDAKRYGVAFAQDRLDILRLSSLLAGKKEFSAPSDLDPGMVLIAQRQMAAQMAEVQAKLEAIDRQIDQKRAEGLGINAAIAKIEDSLPLISEQRDIRSSLLKNQYGSRLAYLQTQQQVVEDQHELEAQKQRRSENAEALAALERQHAQIAAEHRKNLLTDLAKSQVQASEHREEIAKSEMRRSLRTLLAPVDGTIQQLAVHTLGGVVTPAEHLMVIVPRDAGLEIEAVLANKDIGFVRKGQPAEVKIEAFDFTRYGLIRGVVDNVSRDVVASSESLSTGRSQSAANGAEEERYRQGNEFYVARVALPVSSIRTEQGLEALEPGMGVTVEIKTGRRRIIDYLLSPLQRLVNESLGER